MIKYRPLNLSRVKTISIANRKSKVRLNDFASVHKTDSFSDFIDSLPNILAGRDFKEVVDAILKAKRKEKPIVWALGAHVIKCGLNPIIINLMKKGFVSCVALNGGGCIHDVEIALNGKTSEYVENSLKYGSFGMAHETAEFINNALRKNLGFGEAVGKKLLKVMAPYNSYSILASAAELEIPVTVHVAIGTDIIHMHPNMDGSLTGKVSYTDFKIFSSVVSNLEGGVFLNIGSAVILPEIFLKAVNVVRNLGHEVRNFTTVNFDFQLQYRAMENVVKRPTANSGKGYYIVGHHEIMIPLLAGILLEKSK